MSDRLVRHTIVPMISGMVETRVVACMWNGCRRGDNNTSVPHPRPCGQAWNLHTLAAEHYPSLAQVTLVNFVKPLCKSWESLVFGHVSVTHTTNQGWHHHLWIVVLPCQKIFRTKKATMDRWMDGPTRDGHILVSLYSCDAIWISANHHPVRGIATATVTAFDVGQSSSVL
jgi:hypothetical protein